MRNAPNYSNIINEIDELNNEYQNKIKNFIHFTLRQQNHIINHLNFHQNSFITFLNRKTNKKDVAQVYLNKYNDLIQNHPELKNNPNFHRELMNDIVIINAQLWNVIQLKKTEDVEKLESFQNDGYKEKEINCFYKYLSNIFLNEANKYLKSINVIKQYYLYSDSTNNEDFIIDYKTIILNNIDENGNIIYKINTLFTNSLIMIIKQDEKIKKLFDDYKNNLFNINTNNPNFVKGISKKSNNSHHSGKTSKSKMKKKGKNTNLLNNTFNIIEEEFKNQIKNEKNKLKYRLLLLKFFSIKYVKNIYKVFDDTYINLDEFIVDSVKKQNFVLNEFIEYLKSSLHRYLNYITSSDFEFDSFDIYNKYKLKIEDYFINIKEEDDKKLEIKKYFYNINDLYSLYLLTKEYSSESINYLVKTNIVKEILIKKYFIENPSNLNNKAISVKIRELNFENYHFFFSLFEEYDGKYVNINELFTTLILIGSNTISNEKWKELVKENILKEEDFMKINFWFENDIYLNKCIDEDEENIIKERGEEFTKVQLIKEIIFKINEDEGKIDMRKLERMFKIINGEEKKEKEEKEKKEENEEIKKEENEEIKKEDNEEIKKEDNEEIKNDEEDKKDILDYEKNKNEKIENDIIKEDEEEESSSSNEEEEGFPHIKIQKSKMSDNKLLIFNLVFNIHNNP